MAAPKYTHNEMIDLLKALDDVELEAAVIGGEQLPDLYIGMARMNKEHTAGVYILNADDIEHNGLLHISPEIVAWLFKAPDMMRQLLEENKELRQRIALADWEPRAL